MAFMQHCRLPAEVIRCISLHDMTRANRKKDSIYTLAEELSLSPATVSRALRNRPEIGVRTRQVVRQHAAKVGFKLRSFTPRVTNICVVIETEPGQRSLFSAFVDSVLDGVWRYCVENDVELSLYGEEGDTLAQSDLVRVLGRRGVNAAVFLNASAQSTYFSALNEQNFPYCCVMTSPPEARPWIIRADGTSLGRKATEFLVELGHHRIALIDSLENHDIGRERRAGYLQALEAAGLSADPELIFTHSACDSNPIDDFDFAASAVRTLLDQKPSPTAFLTMSDEAGLATLHELAAYGLEVPKAASVLSFDDSRLCAFANPALSAVSVPYERIGYDAAAMAHRRLEKNTRATTRTGPAVAGSLVIRGSTGRAPRA